MANNKCFLYLLQEFALWALDGKETKDQALPARRPITALLAKTAELASLEQPPFWPLPSA